MKRLLPALFALFILPAASAITPAEMKALQPNDLLQWKNEQQQLVSAKVISINQFKESDGSLWFRANAQTAEGTLISWLLDPSEKGEIELINSQKKLREAGLSKKDIYQADKAGKGTITYEGVNYDFLPDDSDDVQYLAAPGGEADEISYYNFASQQDDDDGLLVIEWDDDKFELFETEFHELAELTVVPAKP